MSDEEYAPNGPVTAIRWAGQLSDQELARILLRMGDQPRRWDVHPPTYKAKVERWAVMNEAARRVGGNNRDH